MTTPTQSTEIQEFRKKPVVIKAVQWDGTFSHAKKLEAELGLDTDALTAHPPTDTCTYWKIRTLEDGHVVSPGDWIITGVKGEHYPCKPDIFEMTYEPVTIDQHKTPTQPGYKPTETAEREAFEAWSRENRPARSLFKNRDGRYLYFDTAIAWTAWQARATLSQQDAAVPEYWQWRRKEDPWKTDQIYRYEVFATTEDSEVRKLYANSQATGEVELELTDEQIAELSLKFTNMEPLSDFDYVGFARAVIAATAKGEAS